MGHRTSLSSIFKGTIPIHQLLHPGRPLKRAGVHMREQKSKEKGQVSFFSFFFFLRRTRKAAGSAFLGSKMPFFRRKSVVSKFTLIL